MLIHILVLLGFIAMALLTAAGKGFSHWHGEAVDALLTWGNSISLAFHSST